MGQITSLYVHKVVGEASEGVVTRDLVEALGLDPDGPIDPARMVASDDYYRFFARLEERDPDGLGLPWRIGASMQSDDYGAFGLAWKSAPDLRGSFARAERYARVLSSVEVYQLERGSRTSHFTLHKEGDGSRGMTLSNEASIAAVCAISGQVSAREFRPLAVHFKHGPRGSPSAYEVHFGCPVQFECERDAIVIDDAMLAAPNRLGDPTIARFFDRHLEGELEEIAARTSLDEQVVKSITQALSAGLPSVSEIAGELGMSARSLQRRLAEDGHRFQGLVDRARQGLARKLLNQTDYSLAEIAFLTGFSEQSGFTRAFKRWEEMTPGAYRKKQI